MFRLAHISDVHLGPLPDVSAKQLLSKRITGYINFRKNRMRSGQPQIVRHLIEYLQKLGPDHTAITGDLINLGLDEEIVNAGMWLTELGHPKHNTAVLGNHDAYVRGALKKAMTAWQDWISGDDEKSIRSAKDYPILRRREEISIVGCNSARASMPFLATGYFRKDQAERLAGILAEEGEAQRYRVVLIHHPPYEKAADRHKRLLGISNFKDAIKTSGAELVLHGHTHLPTIAYIEGKNGAVPVCGVSAAYQWTGHRKPPAAINLFEISRSNEGWHTRLQRHVLQEGAKCSFALETDQSLSEMQEE